MFKNMKLSMKLGLSFGLIILIAFILGGLAVFNMNKITVESKKLAEEYAPEVDIVTNIERTAALLMYDMRGYGYSGVEKFYTASVDSMKTLKKYLSDCSAHAEKSKNLTKLKDQLAVAKKYSAEYEELMNQTKSSNIEINNIQNTMVKSGADFVKYANDLLAIMEKNQDDEIKRKESPDVLTRRVSQIKTVNDIINLGNAIRIANWKAQAERDPSIIKDIMPNFDSMESKMKELFETVKQQKNKEAMANLTSSIAEYKKELTSLLTIWTKLQDVNVKRTEVGNKVLASTQVTSKDGVEQTLSVAKDAVSILKTSSNIMIVGLILALILGIIIATVMTKMITGPLFKGVIFAQEIAKGNLNTRLDLDQKDEVGQLAKALQDMLSQLQQVVSDVKTAADNVAAGSEELSASAQQMSQGSTEQAASAEEVSSSMEQMTSNINQNADNALQTEKIAQKTSEKAEEGGKAVSETVTAMKEIASKISIIEEIARQTNLLALNAAIEAARAGEHGKGFAVVASEVRKLAERSQQAAGEISELSKTSVEIADKAGNLLSEILPDIKKTAELVQEITAGSNEQRTGVEQINQAIQQLDQVIQQNASTSEEMAATSEELSSQAEMLTQTISFFKLDESIHTNASFKKGAVKKVSPPKHDIHTKAIPPAHKMSEKKQSEPSKKGVKINLDTHDEFQEF